MADNLSQRLNQRESSTGGINSVQTSNYGGLNTISNRLNMPMEDSPLMRNCKVTPNGTIRKRDGTFNMFNANTLRPSFGTLGGYTMIPYTLRNGERIIIQKEGTSLVVYYVRPVDLANNILEEYLDNKFNFPNVWSSTAGNVRCDYIITSETTPRIIMTTGVNTVVQMSIAQSSLAKNGNHTSIDFGDTRIPSGITANTLLFRNNVLLKPTVDYTVAANGVITFTSTVVNPTGMLYDFVYISWQWWTEAMRLLGKNIAREVTQFQISSPTDLTLAVPPDLLLDIEALSVSNYPLQPYAAVNLPAGILTRGTATATNTDFVWSQGAAYTAGTTPITGFTHINFGAFSGALPQPPRRLVLFRHYSLPFQGFLGTTANTVTVYDDRRTWRTNVNWVTNADETLARDGSNADPTFALCNTSGVYTSNRTLNVPGIVTPNQYSQWIRFDTSTGNAIQPIDIISVVSTKLTSADGSFIIGTSATNSVITTQNNKLAIGAAFPIFGFYEVCDFGRRSFPRTITQFSGRVALGGFPDAPLRVALSGVLDSLDFQKYYNNFQTSRIALDDNSPFFIELGAASDDSVTAMVEFQNSLFIFCRKSMYRLSGTQSGSVTLNQFNVSFVTGIGALNPQSVTKVDKTVYFVSASGVYDIVPTLDSGDFTAGERSLKIRSLVQQNNLGIAEQYSWACYEPIEKEVFLCIPDSNVSYYCASRMYVYNILRDAWSEYTFGTQGYFNSIHGAALSSGASKSDVFVHMKFNFPSATEERTTILKMNYKKFCIDNATYDKRSFVGNTLFLESQGSYSSIEGISDLTNYNGREFNTMFPQKTINGRPGVELNPLLDVKDVDVKINGVINNNYNKVGRNSLVLNYPINSGDEISFTKVDPVSRKYPVAVYVDNILIEPFDVGILDTVFMVGFENNIPVGSQTYIGNTIECWHFTPLVFADSLENSKRLTKYIGYYKNNNDRYLASDTNPLTSQAVSSIVSEFKIPADVNVAFVYEDTDSGYTTEDLYKFRDLYWDDSLFDVTPASKQYKDYVRLSEPLLGTSYGIQCCNWNCSEGSFELVGYEIIAKAALKNSRVWSE